MAKLRGEAGAVLDDLMLLGTEKTNGVIVEDIALHLFGEMATAHEFETGRRSHGVGGKQARCTEVGAIHSLHRAGRHPRKARTGRVQKEILSVSIERDAPRVRNAELCMTRELFGAWAVAEEATIGTAHWAVHRLHIAM